MSLDQIKQQLEQKLAFAAGLQATAKFNFGDEGIIYVDSTKTPPEISDKDEDADVELVTSIEVFQGILNGTQDPNIAFMMGKLKVKGNMGLAMKLNSILED